MAVRATAGKLGLGLAALGNISSSFTMRRCCSLSAAAIGSLENMEKRIYICTLELVGPRVYAKQVVRPIPWNTDDEDGVDDEDRAVVKLLEAAYRRRYKYYNLCAHTCTAFGSLILLPCGPDSLHMSCIDTSTRPLRFQVFSPDKSYGKTLTSRKHNVMLGEVDGKLYRIDNNIERFQIDPDSCAFQVFDPPNNTWLPLPTPPFVRSVLLSYHAVFLNAAKKILGWSDREHKVYVFDTTKPEIGWTYLTYHYIFRYFDNFPGKPLFVHDHHLDLGDFHLMFAYERDYAVSALFISNNFDTFQPIKTKFQLPPEWSEYTTVRYDCEIADVKFVHLGARRVALVIHKCVNGDGGREPGSVLVVAFEYEVSSTQPTVEIQTRLIKTRRYQYHTTHPRKPGPSIYVRLNGAFLL